MANLDGASRNMNEFSRLIRQNPGLLLGGSPREETARARDPERSKRQ
jgi:phospholipid/cholesterol/gamma-HCH transport system substrate-binding protein